jgi:hypothetical protein
MKFGNDQVSVGDGFTRVGNWSGATYVVTSLVEPPGMPPHVRLVADGQRQGDQMLMSVSALLDRRFWQRASVDTR